MKGSPSCLQTPWKRLQNDTDRGRGGGGGHPWEIYRGGNTTHIALGVIERHEGWSVYLWGSSTKRMAETIRIALALTKVNLPVEIHDAK